jgi:hypothetical protein
MLISSFNLSQSLNYTLISFTKNCSNQFLILSVYGPSILLSYHGLCAMSLSVTKYVIQYCKKTRRRLLSALFVPSVKWTLFLSAAAPLGHVIYSHLLFSTNRLGEYCTPHRVYRVPDFLSSRPHWVPPLPHPLGSVAPSPLRRSGGGGGHTRLRERGVGRPNSDEETDTLVLYVYYNPFTVHPFPQIANGQIFNDDVTVSFSMAATVISCMLLPYWLIFLENSSYKVQPENTFVTASVLTQWHAQFAHA